MEPIAFERLKTRSTPRQLRARQRVQVILNATAELLCTHAPRYVTTTAIAEHADIPVSSIYRYFPTIDDVLRELYLQTAAEIRAKVFDIFNDTDAYPGWRDKLRAALETQHDYLQNHPYYRPLLTLFLPGRGPVLLEDEEHDELVAFLEHRWRAGLDGFRGGAPDLVANMVIQTTLSIEDLMAADHQNDETDAYSAELWTLLEGYLANYLND